MTTTKTKPPSAEKKAPPAGVLPAALRKQLPEDLAAADEDLGRALEANRKATDSVRDAEEALKDASSQAGDAALEEAEREVHGAHALAIQAAAAAGELVSQTAARFRASLAEHRAEASDAQRRRVAEITDEVAATINRLDELAERLVVEAGVLRGIHRPEVEQGVRRARRRAQLGHRAMIASIDHFQPRALPTQELEATRKALTEVARTAIPIQDQIMAAVGAGPTAWDVVVAAIGIDGVLDKRALESAKATRDGLIEDTRLVRVDRDGKPDEPRAAQHFPKDPARYLAPAP